MLYATKLQEQVVCIKREDAQHRDEWTWRTEGQQADPGLPAKWLSKGVVLIKQTCF